MTATPLLDTLSDQPENAQRLAMVLVEALLREAEALNGLDALMYPQNASPTDQQRSRQIVEAWHGWIGEAEALLRRLSRMDLSTALRERAEQLQLRWGHAQALIGLSPDRIERARQQIRLGETVGAEEIRRELQLRTGGRRTA
jgi:hypothetical protein